MADLPTIDEALDELGITLPRSRKISCPKGPDSTPSLHVYEDGFYCFHCGESGDGLGLIAFYTNQDIRRLYAERVSVDGGRPLRASTKGLKRGDVHRATAAAYRQVHNDWFKFLHETWADSPQWAFEQALDIWAQAFDDLRDKMLGHGVYDEDGPLTPYLADKAIADFAALLEDAKAREIDDAKQRKSDKVRADYWKRRRALVDPTVYNTR